MLSNEELFLLGDIDTLYERNKKLMYHIANKFSNLQFEYDDFIGCGDLAFTKALKKFNSDKYKWATYFSSIMVNEILIMNRKRSKEVQLISLDTVICEDINFNTLTIQEVVPSREDVMEKVVNLITLDEILKEVAISSSMKSEIFKLYLLGVRQKDIGEKFNLSQSYVSRLIKNMSTGFKSAYEKGSC
jgi:RNA polymerase sporulation-specific sigma factor